MEGKRPSSQEGVHPVFIGFAFLSGLAAVIEAAVNPGEKISDKLIPLALGMVAIGLGLVGVRSSRK